MYQMLKSYNPSRSWFGLFPFRSSLLRESLLIYFFRLLRYFSSPTCLHVLNDFGHTVSRKRDGFPHSEISGSKVDWHLTETYRSHSTSFIAHVSLGIHHTPLHSCKECCTPLYKFECRSGIPAGACLMSVCRGRKDPSLV